MFQKNCANCSKELDIKLINLDLIQCNSCFEKWKTKSNNQSLVKYLELIYKDANRKKTALKLENSNPKPKTEEIDLSGMVF